MSVICASLGGIPTSEILPDGGIPGTCWLESVKRSSKSSSMGLSTEVPKVGSPLVPRDIATSSSSSVRSMSTAWPTVRRSGGGIEARRIDDFGARVTGDVCPLWSWMASSGLNAMEDKSSLCGNGVRCNDDREIVEALLAGVSNGFLSTGDACRSTDEVVGDVASGCGGNVESSTDAFVASFSFRAVSALAYSSARILSLSLSRSLWRTEIALL